MGPFATAPLAAQDPALADSLASALGLARSALEQGRLEEAVSHYRRAQAFHGLGLVYGTGTDDDQAALAIAAGLADAYLALGDAYAARVEAERGVALDDGSARLWTLLGLARHRMADLSAARSAFDRALALDRNEADAEWGLGLVAMGENRPADAAERASRALAIRPDPRYALALARWAAMEGDYRRAVEALDRYLVLVRDDPRAEGYRHMRAFYAGLAGGRVRAIDPRVTRVQLGFDLKRGDEIPYVPVQFGTAQPVYVLLDTGAERNVIDRVYAEEIGLGPILPGGPLHGAYRQTPGGYVTVDRLTMGSIGVTRVPFAVGDFGSLALRGQGGYFIAGVVNPALLFRDFLVVLDYGRRNIELLRFGAGAEEWLARPTSLQRTAVPMVFDANGAWPVVQARLDGSRELPFLVDTGASDLLIARRTAGVLGLDPTHVAVSLGAHHKDDLSALLLDGVPGEPWDIDIHGILGYPFFRGSRVVLDYRHMVMIVEN